MRAFIACDTYMYQPRNIFGFKKKNAKPEELIGCATIGSVNDGIPNINAVITVKGSGYTASKLPPTVNLITDVSRKVIYDVIHEQLRILYASEIITDTLSFLGDEVIFGKGIYHIKSSIAPYMANVPTQELLSASENGVFGLYITPTREGDTLTLREKAQIFLSEPGIEECMSKGSLYKVSAMMFAFQYARMLSKCNNQEDRRKLFNLMGQNSAILEDNWSLVLDCRI